MPGHHSSPFSLDPMLLGLTAAVALLAQVGAGVPQDVSAAGLITGTPAPLRFSGTVDRGNVLQGSDGQVHVELVVASDRQPTAGLRVPTDLVVVLDRSGSMSGDKISMARAAVDELIGQLYPEDRFALISYADQAQLTVPLEPATPLARGRWRQIVSNVPASGSTNMSAGIDLAVDQVLQHRVGNRAPRVVLISDGLPNRGDDTAEGLRRRARRAPQGEFVLTAVGVGLDFDEHLMSSLADAGAGNFYYLNGDISLARVFADELSTARETVASSVRVHITTAPGVQVLDASGYPLQRSGNRTSFLLGSMFAGQERRIWVTLQLPTSTLGRIEPGRFELGFRADARDQRLDLPPLAAVECVADPDAYYASVDKDAWERSVVTEEYNKLRTTVSVQVKSGKKEDAKQAIADYRAAQSAMNSVMQSPAVEANLEELDDLESQVDYAFEGEDQALKQNVLSKEARSQSMDARRAGSKK